VFGVVGAALMLIWWALWFFALPARMRSDHRRAGTTSST
jgi:predicted secreted protein